MRMELEKIEKELIEKRTFGTVEEEIVERSFSRGRNIYGRSGRLLRYLSSLYTSKKAFAKKKSKSKSRRGRSSFVRYSKFTKLISLKLIVVILVEFVLSPLLGFGGLYSQENPFSSRLKDPRGKLDMYFNSAESKSSRDEWDALIDSGKVLLTAEWENKASLEVENLVNRKKLEEGESFQEDEYRQELVEKKSLVRAEWEDELSREIIERRGSWKARKKGGELVDIWENIDRDEIRRAIEEADAVLRSSDGSAEERLATWETSVKSRLQLLKADWEEEVNSVKSSVLSSTEILDAETRQAFERAIEKMEREVMDFYRWEESRFLQISRSNVVLKLNKESDIEDRLAASTNPTELVAALIERTKLKIDETTGKIREDVIAGRQDIPVSISLNDADPQDSILDALENGNRLWEQAIEDLIVRKLEYDKVVKASRREGEEAWAEAYNELLSQRNLWIANFQKDLSEGIRAWDTSEAKMKENKEAALRELDRYVDSRMEEWSSHIRGLEGIAVSSADSIQTIIDSRNNLQEMRSKLPAGHSSIAIYTNQINGWNDLLARFRDAVRKAEEHVHNEDMRGEYGFLSSNSPDRIMTTAELDLAIAEAEWQSAKSERDRALQVLQLAESKLNMTPEEIEAQFALAQEAFQAQQAQYSLLLYQLNGTVGTAGNIPGTDAPDYGDGESILDRLEAARTSVEVLWRELELARTSMEEARRKYDEIAELQIYALNPDLMHYEIGSISSETTNPTGLRYQIEKSYEEIREAKERIRQAQIEVYRQNYERNNAERARSFYNDLTSRIRGYELEKESLSLLNTLLESGDVSAILASLVNDFPISRLVGAENEARVREDIEKLRVEYNSADIGVGESIGNWKKVLSEVDSTWAGFPSLNTAEDKASLVDFKAKIGMLESKLPSNLKGIYTDSWIPMELGYLETLLDDWDEEHANIQAAKLEWLEYVSDNADRLENIATESEPGRTQFLLGMDNKYREFMQKVSVYESYINEVQYIREELRESVMDVIGMSLAQIDVTMMGDARKDATNGLNAYRTEFNEVRQKAGSVLKSHYDSLGDIGSDVDRYLNAFRKIQIAQSKRSGVFASVSNLLEGLLSNQEVRTESLRLQVEFLLNSEATLEDLSRIQNETELKIKVEASKINLRVLQELLAISKDVKGSDVKLQNVYLELQRELDELQKNWKPDQLHRESILVKSLLLQFLSGNSGLVLSLGDEAESDADKEDAIEEFWQSYIDYATDLRNFYSTNNGEMTPEERDRIKREGTANERSLLREYNTFGETFFFQSGILSQYQNRFMVAGSFEAFSQGILSGRIPSIFTDSKYKIQEDSDSGILATFRTYYEDKWGSLPGTADIASHGISSSVSTQLVQTFREFLQEKAAEGGVFNPELMRVLNEASVYTDRMEDWQYVLDHYEMSAEVAGSDLEQAKAHRKALDEMGKVFRELNEVLGKTNGEPMYHDRRAVEGLVTKLEKLQEEVGVSNELEDRLSELKDFVWGIYKGEIAELFLSGRVLPPGGRADDDRPTSLDEFITSLASGKFILSEGSGTKEANIQFFGRNLNESELAEISSYLKVLDRKARIWNQDSISDLEKYLLDEDEDLRDTLRLQILYEKYERINLSIYSGSMINPNQLPQELRNYSVLKAFEMYRHSRGSGLDEAGDRTSFLLFIGPDLAEKYTDLLNAYVSMGSPKSPSMYLPEDLKELDAILEHYYNPVIGDTLELPDQEALATWLEERGYDPSFQEKLQTSARLGYMLDMYYGEELEAFLQEMEAKLGTITPEEERLLLLTLHGYDPAPVDGKWLDIHMDVYHDLSAERFWMIYRQDALHDDLLELIAKEQESLGKQIVESQKDVRKKNFLVSYKKGTVSSDSWIAYINIPASGEQNTTPQQMIERKIEELNQHATSKLGSLFGMLETLSSYAFLEPEGEADDPSRLSFSLQKTQELIKEYYDPSASYTRDGEGNFSYEEDLGNQVLTRLNQYVNANSQDFANENPFNIVSAAMGLWESMKGSIISAAKKIQIVNDIKGGNLPLLLTQFKALFEAEEDRFNTAKTAFENANELIDTINKEYADKQKEVSEEYKTLLTLEKDLSKYESLSDYLSLLEFSKHPIGEDENGNPIYDTTIQSPLKLAQERNTKAEKKFQDAVKKREEAKKRVAEQVTLQEIQNATILEKQATTEWALRAMHFSRAEDRIRNEVNTVRTQLQQAKQTLYAQVEGLLGLQPGPRGAYLNSYMDTTSGAFITEEQIQREIHYYADLIQNGSLNHWSFVAVALQVREPDRGHGKWNGAHVPNAAINPPPGVRSLFDIINTTRPGPIMGLTQPIVDILNQIGIVGQVGLNVRANFNNHTNLSTAIGNFSAGAGPESLRSRGNSYANSTCTQSNAIAKGLCQLAIVNQVEPMANNIADLSWSLHGSHLDPLSAQATTVKQHAARLKHLTEITSSGHLLSVLSETQWGLEDDDLAFLQNTAGGLSALQWTVGGQTVNFNQMVGAGGKPIAQQKKLTDAYGNYQRSGNNHVETLGVSGNEFASVLSVLAETQYTIARDAYFAKQEAVTNDKGRTAERRDILDDREQFLHGVLEQIRVVGIEFGMYQTVLRDYMGSDMSSGGKTVTTRMSVVDEIAQLGIDQQRRLQLKDWELIENNFYQKRSEWLQNMEYLRDTGLKRFDRITTQFMNDRYAWRLDFDKRAEAGEKKYTDAIKETIEAQKQWAVDFAEAAQNPSKRATLNDLYNRIQTMITEVNSGLPDGINSGVNANDILSKYHNRLPDSIDRRWIESAGNVNTDFFLTRISNKELNAKDLMKDYEKLQDEMSDRLAILAKIQALHNLQLYDDQFGEIIQNANEGLQKQLDQEMGMDGFFRAGDKYVKMGQSGMPHIIRNYNFFNYKPIPIPQVRDSNGKQWDMTNLDALLGDDGPSANDLAVMAELAMNSMEYKFQEVYNPEKPETYETPSDYSRFRQAMAGSSFLSGQSQGMELDITKYYLVGEVVGGTFGKHHHDEFFDIISQKEKLAFLDQVVVNEQERKAKKRAAREGMWETVGTVIAVAGAMIITGGAAGPLLYAAWGAVGSYTAYNAHKAYEAGGWTGAALSLGTSALAMFTKGTVQVGGSYSYEQGFGASVGVGFGGTSSNPLFNAGISFTEKGGFGANIAYNASGNMSLGANIHQSGAWGVDASLHQTNKTGQRQGGALKLGYRETADGQVGLSGSIGYNSSSGFSTVSAGYNYDTLLGGGGYVGYTQGNTGLSPISGINSQVSWNVNAGFQSHATFEFSASQLSEALFGPSELTPEQQAIQASLANLSPEERARQKIEHGIPLDPSERAAMEAMAREGQMDAFANMGADVISGLGYVLDKLGVMSNEELYETLGFCFPKGTLIWTPNGFKKIEDLQPGDMVYSCNHETGEVEEKPIVQLFRNTTKDWLEIYTSEKEKIIVTRGHLFYVLEEGYIQAKDIRSGMTLTDDDGKEHVVTKTVYRELEKPEETYNFEVKGNHNYFVGEKKILVHNDSREVIAKNNIERIKKRLAEGLDLSDKDRKALLDDLKYLNSIELYELDKAYKRYMKTFVNLEEQTTEEGIIKLLIDGNSQEEGLEELLLSSLGATLSYKFKKLSPKELGILADRLMEAPDLQTAIQQIDNNLFEDDIKLMQLVAQHEVVMDSLNLLESKQNFTEIEMNELQSFLQRDEKSLKEYLNNPAVSSHIIEDLTDSIEKRKIQMEVLKNEKLILDSQVKSMKSLKKENEDLWAKVSGGVNSVDIAKVDRFQEDLTEGIKSIYGANSETFDSYNNQMKVLEGLKSTYATTIKYQILNTALNFIPTKYPIASIIKSGTQMHILNQQKRGLKTSHEIYNNYRDIRRSNMYNQGTSSPYQTKRMWFWEG